jgi:hypothetical protein
MNAHSKIQRFACACCGGDIGEATTIAAVRAHLTQPTHIIIFDQLSAAPGSPVLRETIITALYGPRTRWPSTALGNLRNRICQLRKIIEPMGWCITHARGAKGDGASWRLIPTEVTP